MPAPDPFGLSYDEHKDGRPIVQCQIWPSSGFMAMGNRRNRMARAKAVLQNLTFAGWTCPECGDHVPMHKRADALYCREACRKQAARRRRRGVW